MGKRRELVEGKRAQNGEYDKKYIVCMHEIVKLIYANKILIKRIVKIQEESIIGYTYKSYHSKSFSKCIMLSRNQKEKY